MPEFQVSETSLDLPVKLPVTQTQIILIGSEREAQDCKFWAGIYRKGHLSPQQLIEQKKTGDILTRAVSEGLDCDEAIVLTEVRENGEPSIHFLVPLQNERLADSHLWLEKLCDAICAWGPEAPGIYFAPELLGADLSCKFLSWVLKALIQREKFSTFFLLIGSHGMHSVLNSTLKLKAKMEEESAHRLSIFH